MATKPTPGASDGTYGTELNAFLDVSLDVNGFIKTEALQTDSTAPAADAAVANKKYVDDQITAALPASLAGGNDSDGETSMGVLEMKWGSFTLAGNTSAAQTFTGLGLSAFSNNCFQVVASSSNTNVAATNDIGISSIVNTGFTATNEGSSSTTVHWIALGR